MAASLKQIEEQALTLSEEDRAELAESMLESLHVPSADVEAAWARKSRSELLHSIAARFLRISPSTYLPKRVVSRSEESAIHYFSAARAY